MGFFKKQLNPFRGIKKPSDALMVGDPVSNSLRLGGVDSADIMDPLNFQGRYGSDRGWKSNEARVAAYYQKDFNNFRRNVLPRIDDRIESLGDNEIVTAAVDRTAGLAKRNAEQQQREDARYGLGMSAAKRAARSRSADLTNAADVAGAENNSRLQQIDRNNQQAMSLANTMSQYRAQGIDDLMQSVGLGSSRAMNNSASKAQARQQNIGTAASIATVAAMIW